MNRENEIINVRVDEIIPNRLQPRLTFNQTELKELSDSIKVHGIIQPLVLRRIGDKFEIIAGERRHKAAMLAGLTTVPAIIMNIDDKQSAEVAVVENLQRKDLTAIEEAQSYKKIIDMGSTQEELAARMGITQPTIANKLRLLSLPDEVQKALLKNQISERHARSLLQIPDNSLQVSMLNKIITDRMTVRQTDEEIAKILGKSITNTVPSPSVERNIEEFNTQNPSINTTPINNYQNPVPNENIIKEHKPSDIDMLLRKEPSNNFNDNNVNKKISLEDEKTNIDMGNIVTNPMPSTINPFQEVETEIMNFEIPTEVEKQPTLETNNLNNSNSLIEEFKQQNQLSYQNIPESKITEQKSISSAINVARNEVRKIEELGFTVDTEEFDFEDMYQIIIKIKKD